MNEKLKDVGLRLTPEFHRKLKDSATKNRRSINSEIIVALELLFAKEKEEMETLTENELEILGKINSLPLDEQKAVLKKISKLSNGD